MQDNDDGTTPSTDTKAVYAPSPFQGPEFRNFLQFQEDMRYYRQLLYRKSMYVVDASHKVPVLTAEEIERLMLPVL